MDIPETCTAQCTGDADLAVGKKRAKRGVDNNFAGVHRLFNRTGEDFRQISTRSL